MVINPLHLGISCEESSLGGLNRFAREITKAQREEGVHASLIGERIEGNIFEFGIEYDHLTPSWTKRNILRRSQIKKLLEEYEIMDIHFARENIPLIGLNLPKLIHFHGPWYLESRQMNQLKSKVLAKFIIESATYSHTSQFITLSRAFADLLVTKFRIKSSRIEVIPPGINIPYPDFSKSEIDSFLQRFNLRNGEIFLISVRRLVPRMGLEVLICALAEMNVPQKLLIIGDGPLMETLKKLVEDLQMTNYIKFTGKLNERELQIAYSLASLSVLPSISLEGFGLSALESMAFGTPVIATNCGGLNELMSGLPLNYLVPPNSVTDLRNALEVFFAEKECLRSLFYNHALQYSWTTTVAKTNELYEKVLMT